MPYRIAAPPEPDPPDVEHPYAAVIRREQKKGRLVAVAAALALCTVVVSALARPAPSRAPIDDEAARLSRARTSIAAARTRATNEQARFEGVLAEARATGITARPDLGACPITLPRAGNLARRRAFPLLTVAPDDARVPSQALAEALSDVLRAEGHVAAGQFDLATLYARALEHPDRLRYEVVVVASTWKKPRATSPTSYEPGAIADRAYLYDFGERRVVCAADVHASSSPRIGYAYATTHDAPASLGRDAQLAESVDEDMRASLERAVAEAMTWRAGPPLP